MRKDGEKPFPEKARNSSPKGCPVSRKRSTSELGLKASPGELGFDHSREAFSRLSKSGRGERDQSAPGKRTGHAKRKFPYTSII